MENSHGLLSPPTMGLDEATSEASESLSEYFVALYYCYVSIEHVAEQVEWQKETCEALGLFGRIRVSVEGLNGVLSGTRSHLRLYEDQLRMRVGDDTELDVKYCPLRSDLAATDQLFTHLSVKATAHVVSLIPNESHDDQLRAIYHQAMEQQRPATHLDPLAWNQAIAEAPNPILVDCRNVYESNVGHFEGALLTNTRQYSELPRVLLDQAPRLQEASHVFMYCTGGVRCERASQFLQQVLPEQKIYQLHGGIQRYMESEHATLYRGKNFVFDPRRYDPQAEATIVGRCVVCNTPHDDYDLGAAPSTDRASRCVNCRILILVCPECRTKVQCWGDDDINERPRLTCGGIHRDCIRIPPPQVAKRDTVAT